jgi:restriction system protein
MRARIGQLKVSYSARGLARYEMEIWHDGLHKHRVIRGTDPQFIQRKVEVQLADWDDQWKRRSAVANRAQQAAARRQEKEEQKRLAAEQTAEAKRLLEDLQATLQHTLSVDDAIDWEMLKDRSEFPKPRPAKPKQPSPPTPAPVPREPQRSDAAFQPHLSFLDKLLSGRRARKEEEASQLFERAHQEWDAERRRILASNEANQRSYRERLQRTAEEHERSIKAWEQERDAFLREQREQNAAVDRQKESYLSGAPEAILGYCDMVLARSDYPDFFPKEWELDFNPETGVLIVDYSLPAPDDIPTLVEVKYVATKDEFSEKHLTESQRDKLYDTLLYQVVLRTIHELLEADAIGALKTVVFNGYVRAVDRSTGNEVNACVLSLQARREEFLNINLANVDPKACFRQLKGVGSSKLHSVTPIAPIVSVSREDARFVSSYDVAHHLDEGYNLATMDWQDFEHLIREIFAREFAQGGGEVRVTQASRDGGIDAVAFDPDPIRGGKIVIQAKRYTGTVGVSAVRDLFGTLQHEGATKGILVTTSDYGPDAYEFAKGKPLTLLNGSNLLHLLEKHGHKARINLREAREQSRARSD